MLYTAGGSQMAMPAWAYFYQQVFNDKSLNIDPEAAFIPPSNMQNEIIFDYDPFAKEGAQLPAEGEEGNKSTEYVEIPISDGKEKVVTESKKFEEQSLPAEQPKPLVPSPQKQEVPKPDSSAKKREYSNEYSVKMMADLLNEITFYRLYQKLPTNKTGYGMRLVLPVIYIDLAIR